MEIYFFYVLSGLIVLFILFRLFFYILRKKVGDCSLEWADGYLQNEPIEFLYNNQAVIKFAIPVKSTGKQQCLVVDMIGRIQPEGDKFTTVENSVKIYSKGNKRGDDYWEAIPVKPGNTLIVAGEIRIKTSEESIEKVLINFKHIYIDIYYKYYCRSLMEYRRKVIKIDLLKALGTPVVTEEEWVTMDEGKSVLPIRTPLLTPQDNIYEVYEKYVKKHQKPGDVLAICESALAIMEGRAYYVEDIKPGFLATHMNLFFKMDSSLSSPYSLEMAIREVGTPRILFAFLMGILGRIVGRAGDFYLFAGRAVATIDDCTGTLPPFDKYVVMGPKDPKKTAEEFKQKTGLDLTVVDVNDLGKVDVLTLTQASARQRVIAGLKSNPQGNANQQTPIALIRKEN